MSIREAEVRSARARGARLRGRGVNVRNAALLTAVIASAAGGIGVAVAADPPVEKDCAKSTSTFDPQIKSCEFVQVGAAREILGAEIRVSPELNNCNSTVPLSNSFTWSYTVGDSVYTESGELLATEGTFLSASLGSLSGKLSQAGFDVSTAGNAQTIAGTLGGDVPPHSKGWVVLKPKRVEVSGHYVGVYFDPGIGKDGVLETYPLDGKRLLFPVIGSGEGPPGDLTMHIESCGGSAPEPTQTAPDPTQTAPDPSPTTQPSSPPGGNF